MRFLLSFVLLLALLTPALADERILSYDSGIEVQSDGSMVVVETIEVRAEGDQIKRGIYRDFPTDYRDRIGNRVRVEFSVLSVTRDGASEPYHTKRLDNGVRVYIGQSDHYLRPGVYRYAIAYRTDRQLGFFADHDELYWNVTGNSWVFPIDRVTARVSLPQQFSADSLGAEAYTGYTGEQGQDYTASVVAPGSVAFATTRGLAGGEGLTIVVTWPKGFVHTPTQREQLDDLLRDNATWTAALIGLTLLISFYLLAWQRVGRDPQQGIVFPRYLPPDGFSPAAIRYIEQMGYDKRTFVVALVNLAVKGLITISEDDDEYTLRRSDQKPIDLAAGEKVLLRTLFPGEAKSLVLKQTNHQRIGKALKQHAASLKRDFEKRYFLTNRLWLIPGILFSILAYAAVVLQLTSSEQLGMALGMSAWLTGWSVAVFTLGRQVRQAWQGVRSGWELFPAIGVTLFATPFFAAEVVVLGLLGYQTSPAIPLTLLVVIGVNLLFYQLLKAPTLIGRKLLDEVDGFRLYLDVAEKDEMNLRHPPEKTPQLFERFLPYALALGVEQRWSERFADTLARLDSAEGGYRPVWYSGSHWDSAHPVAFSSSLGGALGSAVAASSSAPGSSSGSGGGGSSGGGGGGGGGGGW